VTSQPSEARGAISALVTEYARRYSGRDAEGVAELCLWPFLTIRGGTRSYLADGAKVRDHFAAMIDAYRQGGYASFRPVSVTTHLLGEQAAFTTVREHALDSGGEHVRDTETTYHLLADPGGWRFLSYTNHF